MPAAATAIRAGVLGPAIDHPHWLISVHLHLDLCQLQPRRAGVLSRRRTLIALFSRTPVAGHFNSAIRTICIRVLYGSIIPYGPKVYSGSISSSRITVPLHAVASVQQLAVCKVLVEFLVASLHQAAAEKPRRPPAVQNTMPCQMSFQQWLRTDQRLCLVLQGCVAYEHHRTSESGSP